MSERPFRFIHASDFHLDQPLSGVSDVPDHLRSLFVDAPYRAAERVFDQAVALGVDFVVLAGDLLHAESAGPRGLVFLAEQFQRLADHRINVYWCGGEVDPPEQGATAVRLPDNVHTFSRVRPEEYTCSRDGAALAHIVGVSHSRRKVRAGDFWPEASGLYTIAVAHGEAERAALATRGIHYWALGGQHARHTILANPNVAHYPGTHQGRTPAETGPHGCTLVDVTPGTPAHLSLLPTDVLRWESQRMLVDHTTTRDELEQTLSRRLEELLAQTPGHDLLVSWSIGGQGALLRSLHRGMPGDDLLGRLRSRFAHRLPAAWSCRLTIETDRLVPDDADEQETLLGEYVRVVYSHLKADALARDPAKELSLDSYLSERHLAGSLAGALNLHDSETRRRVLRNAAALGTELLCGEDHRS